MSTSPQLDDCGILRVEELRPADLKFLAFCRKLGWGKFELEVKNGEPVMAHCPVEDRKFSDR
ncbi:hypothetical protein LCGC14_0952580 [marine sediment metagenome]|uniref:Uncharacterized protein n=1 Tax=marine sediment metagenome TaxID=412755 RepID=A0A0F9NLD1_9ZZZZ